MYILPHPTSLRFNVEMLQPQFPKVSIYAREGEAARRRDPVSLVLVVILSLLLVFANNSFVLYLLRISLLVTAQADATRFRTKGSTVPVGWQFNHDPALDQITRNRRNRAILKKALIQFTRPGLGSRMVADPRAACLAVGAKVPVRGPVRS